MTKENSGVAVTHSRRSRVAASRDWKPFAENLAAVLSRLEEDQFLIVSAKNSNRYIQFACQGAWGNRVEVTSNHFLKGEDRLTRRQVSWLRAHGWSAPTGRPREATPNRDPDGAPNYYIDFLMSEVAIEIARVAVEALVNGLEYSHPGALTYEAFDADGNMLTFQELGLKPVIRQGNALMDQVLGVFREVTGIADLAFDEDGDISVRYGSIVVGALPLDNKVRLFSALVTKIAESPALLRKLNQINDGVHRIRCFLHDESVYASLDLPAAPFVPAHLAAGLNEFSEAAKGLAIVLRAEFSGNAVIEPSGPVIRLH